MYENSAGECALVVSLVGQGTLRDCLDLQLDSKTVKVTSLSPGRGTLTNK